jgi:predicted DCC family thiol-disulfide oxidoreductase YuxK
MASLTILYDGACPLCLREVSFLRKRDVRLHADDPRLAFVDIDDPGYDPAAWGSISYGQAMGRIHALASDGSVIRDVEVFRQAYALVGLGWLYGPSRWPLLRALVDGAYRLWAGLRLRFTGRPDLETLIARRTGDLSEPSRAGILCADGRCTPG